ncbi:MAG: hypothetical protein AB8G11_17970 [Saprospiraceae bacterium]
MKYIFIVCFFSLSLNTFAQTGSGSIEQTFIFQLADKKGKNLNINTIKKHNVKVTIKEANNLTYNGLSIKGEYVISKTGERYYGDYNEVASSNLTLIYEYDNEKMTVKINRIQAVYFKISSIPFKSGYYTLDLQPESDFIKKLVIKPIDWTYSKVIFEEVKKVKAY